MTAYSMFRRDTIMYRCADPLRQKLFQSTGKGGGKPQDNCLHLRTKLRVTEWTTPNQVHANVSSPTPRRITRVCYMMYCKRRDGHLIPQANNINEKVATFNFRNTTTVLARVSQGKRGGVTPRAADRFSVCSSFTSSHDTNEYMYSLPILKRVYTS